MLRKVQVDDFVERLAEHAIETGLEPHEVADQFTKRCLEIMLDLEGGNQMKTARRLGIHRNTLSRRMRQHGIAAKGYMTSRGSRGEVL